MKKHGGLKSLCLLRLGIFIALALLVGTAFLAYSKAPVAWSFAVIGDTRNNSQTFNKLLDLVLEDPSRPEMLFHTGDMVHKGSDNAGWIQYKRAIAKLAGRIDVYPVVGNHEMYGDRELSNYKREARPPGGKLYYAFTHRDAGFIVLDSYMPGPTPKISTGQMSWLKNTLGRMRPHVRYIFAFMHHPLLTRKTYRHPNPVMNSRDVIAVLRSADVTAIFVGHEHRYDYLTADGIHQFVCGGGGAPLYGKSEGAFYHYCRVVIMPLNVRVVAVDRQGKERTKVTIPIPPTTPAGD